MRIKAVVSQQSNKVDDLINMFVVVRFVSDKDPSCIQEQQIKSERSEQQLGQWRDYLQTHWTLTLLQRERRAMRRVLLLSWSVVATARS